MTYRTQFENELEELKLSLMKMGDLVIKNIHLSLNAFMEMDVTLANKIIQDDKFVNQLEYEIEKECMHIILKEQPVAKDLRLITAVLKMITDLERIGDHAADISKLTVFMEKNSKIFILKQVYKMAQYSEEMIRIALESFVNQDQEIALKVIDTDDIVDDYFNEVKKEVANAIRQNNIDADYALYLMMVTKYLERIGDHAVNIAEWVIFSIVGHHRK
ncbi:MAG: phosphate signaling complex protein PhoU [Candidatus Izemoplasmatales bacterium]